MKLFSVNKKQSPILITLLAIISLGFIYVFIYIPRNEKIIREQRFRVLQNIDKNVHEKISNSVILLKNLLTAYEEPSQLEENRNFTPAVLNEYQNSSSANFSFIPRKEFRKDTLDAKAIARIDSLDDVYSLEVNNKTQQIVLRYFKKYPGSTSIIAHEIGLKFSFEQFISFLLPQNVFDEYIVFSNGKTVYETFPAGISYVKSDSLLGIKNGLSASSVHDFSISGKDYKLFLQPIQFTADTEWVIGGLLSSKRYQEERKKLPFQVILLLITFAVCLIVSAPWIKLFHMGNKDRLTVFDGALSGLVAMLLVSILFLSFFKYNLPFRTDNSPDSKKNLADNITLAFKKEIDSAARKLYKYNSILKTNRSLLAHDIVYKDRSFKLFPNDNNATGIDPLLKDLAKDSDNYLSVTHLFWLDANGDEIFKWTTDSFMAPHANFSSREYFKKVKERKTYSLTSLNDSIDFYLDQIISWTSGGFTTILSIPYSQNYDTVASISFNAKSLANAILPAGYQFALIDQKGNVLYHSEPSHNLNENLLDKFSATTELQSSLNSHTEATFVTNYSSRKYNTKVKPLTELPYFIVILSDTAFRETRDLEIYSFTFTLAILFFAFLVFEMTVIFFASARRSFFKKQLFDTTWVGPKQSAHGDYLLSGLFNIIVIISLIFFFSLPSFLTYGFLLMISVSFLTLFLNLLYFTRYKVQGSNKYLFKQAAILFLSGIIVIINYMAWRMLERGHLVTFFTSELIFILIGALILYLRKKYLKKQIDEGIKPNNQKNYINSFTFMILTRLVVTSGIPVVFFYISSYNFEQNLITRYKQADFANKLMEKFSPDNLHAINTANKNQTVYLDSAWIKNVSIVDSVSSVADYSKEDRISIQLLSKFRPDITNEAITEKKFYQVNSADSVLFYNSIMEDAMKKDSGVAIYKNANSPGNNLKITSLGLNYNFPILFHYNRETLFWLFLVVAYGSFFFLLKTIIKKLFAIAVPDLAKWEQLDERILCDNRLNHLAFVLGAPGAKKKKNLLQKVRQGSITGKNNEALIYNENTPWDNNVFIADLINIPDSDQNQTDIAIWERYRKEALDEKYKLVIVNHFEYNIENQTTNRIKLNFLESLMIKEKTKIIILSTVHPMAFLDSVFFEEKNKSVNYPISREDVERWNVLLGHYRIVLLTLEQFPENEALVTDQENSVTLNSKILDTNATYEWSVLPRQEKELEDRLTTSNRPGLILEKLKEGVYEFELKITDKNGNVTTTNKIITVHNNHEDKNDLLHTLICTETDRTEFLNKMRFRAIDAAHAVAREEQLPEKKLNGDELAYKLQFTSYYFYLYIWQSLTKEEKFLLYDLAEDNLVNSFDSYNLSILIGKGIIYRDKEGTLKLFNKGFRNFILTAIGNAEAMKIKDQIRDNGNWSKWKAPLIVTLVAILVFLMVSQEDTYSKLLAYVGALGAAIPVFLRLLSFFDKSPQKP